MILWIAFFSSLVVPMKYTTIKLHITEISVKTISPPNDIKLKCLYSRIRGRTIMIVTTIHCINTHFVYSQKPIPALTFPKYIRIPCDNTAITEAITIGLSGLPPNFKDI